MDHVIESAAIPQEHTILPLVNRRDRWMGMPFLQNTMSDSAQEAGDMELERTDASLCNSEEQRTVRKLRREFHLGERGRCGSFATELELF